MSDEYKKLSDAVFDDSFVFEKSTDNGFPSHGDAEYLKNLLKFYEEGSADQYIKLHFCKTSKTSKRQGIGTIFKFKGKERKKEKSHIIGFVRGSIKTINHVYFLDTDQPCKIILIDEISFPVKDEDKAKISCPPDLKLITPKLTFIGQPNGIAKITFGGESFISTFTNFKLNPNAYYIKLMINGNVMYGKCDKDGNTNESSESLQSPGIQPPPSYIFSGIPSVQPTLSPSPDSSFTPSQNPTLSPSPDSILHLTQVSLLHRTQL